VAESPVIDKILGTTYAVPATHHPWGENSVQFEINMRDGSSFEIEASYVEVVNGPTSSTYTLLGAVPGFPTAILAAFPVDLVLAVLPLAHSGAYRSRSSGTRDRGRTSSIEPRAVSAVQRE